MLTRHGDDLLNYFEMPLYNRAVEGLNNKAKADIPIKFKVQIELGDGKNTPPEDVVKKANDLLGELKDGLRLE